jgi:hypothetical protein
MGIQARVCDSIDPITIAHSITLKRRFPPDWRHRHASSPSALCTFGNSRRLPAAGILNSHNYARQVGETADDGVPAQAVAVHDVPRACHGSLPRWHRVAAVAPYIEAARKARATAPHAIGDGTDRACRGNAVPPRFASGLTVERVPAYTATAAAVIYGDSSGCGIAAATVLKMRDRGLGMPAAAALLVSAWRDVTPATRKPPSTMLTRTNSTRSTAAMPRQRSPTQKTRRTRMLPRSTAILQWLPADAYPRRSEGNAAQWFRRALMLPPYR